MSKELYIEALSTTAPETSEELGNILEEHFDPLPGSSLVVLPEYFVAKPGIYEPESMNSPKIETLSNYALFNRAHVFTGMVEQEEGGDKHISGLLFGPSGDLIGKRQKRFPTPFELDNGVIGSSNEMKTYELEDNLGTVAIALCVESFWLDAQLRLTPSDILINPRGFDLDDDRFGTFSESWFDHNADLARMGRRIVVGATGSMGQPGPMAEIINSEGRVAAYTLEPNDPVAAIIDLDKLREYKAGEYLSKYVPELRDPISDKAHRWIANA